MNGTLLLFLSFAYLSGSVPYAKIVGKRHGIDIQKHGSGNIGFANTVRVLGWQAGSWVLLGDILKGTIPVLLAKQYLNLHQVLLVALAAILGHIFPIWLKFRGGKGIATGLGTTLAIAPSVALAGIIIYLLSFSRFRKSAPSSLLAAWSLPFLCLLHYPQYALFYLGLAIVTIWTHRLNLQALLLKT